MMKILKRMVCAVLVLIILVQLSLAGLVYAAQPEVQKPPEKLRVEGIGRNLYDGFYMDFRWEYPGGFFVPGSIGTYLNFYQQEVAKPYKSSPAGRVPAEKDIRAESGGDPVHRIKNLKSGTIYYFDAAAYYKYIEGTVTKTSDESVSSNRIKTMTDISIAAYSVGVNQIKIEWDDVWDLNGRINYKLYISDNPNFTNTPAKYIEGNDVGQGKPVQVNPSSGKLEYTHTVNQPGKVYYVKVVPEITDPELLYYPKESGTVLVSSFILVKTTKVSSSSDGSIWRLDWSPVIPDLGSSVDIKYEIYKGKINSSELPGRIQTVNNTSILVVMKPGEEASSYFIVRADVRKNGVPAYPGIKIESDKVMLRDQEVPAYPPAPQLVDQLGSVTAEAGDSTAKLLWKLPKKADGSIDQNTSYDVWITTDPNIIDDPLKLGGPVSWEMKSGASSGSNGSYTVEFDLVKNNSNILGCQAVIKGLSPNSTYYFRIKARKRYLEYDEEDRLVYKPYSSDPVLKIIITLAKGGISQPITPPRPPFRVKKTPAKTDMVTDRTAVVQIKKRWFERYNEETNRWEYVKTEKENPNDTDIGYDPSDLNSPQPDGIRYRMVDYDEGVTVDVCYVKYQDGMAYDELYDEKKYSPTVVKGYKLIPNDADEDPVQNLDLPDIEPENRQKRNVNLLIENLDPNTTYVVWVRAVRDGAGRISEPSDPVIVTTGPVDTRPPEKPTVPTLIVNQVGDTFVDLVWDFREGYRYYIRYGAIDDVDRATGNITVDLQGRNYFRVDGLNKNTLYYFRIMAEYVDEQGRTERSVWSDSVPVKTLPDIPPQTPGGFGIKNAEDAVTKNSITYEWLKEEGLEYILEVASNIHYADVKEYKAGAVSEFKVTGLKSNVRYYARLYAYDPVKQLKSRPTLTIAVKTLRSSDDYDSDVDTDDLISGDFVEKDIPTAKGIWTIRIIGANADRLIEHVQNDRKLDYLLDLSKPPSKVKKVRIIISVRVYEALTRLKENLVIITGDSRLVIRPGTITRRLAGKEGDFNFDLSVSFLGKPGAGSTKNLRMKTGVTAVELSVLEGSNTAPLQTFDAPLKVYCHYTGSGWYREGKTFGVSSDSGSSGWTRLGTSNSYDEISERGFLEFEMAKPGEMAVAEQGDNYFDDIYGNLYEDAIVHVASVHRLKSVAGRRFDLDGRAVIADTAKFMLDVMDYDYGSDYMQTAAKAGLIQAKDAGSGNSPCTREKAVSMVVRVYEIKTGSAGKPSGGYIDVFSDMSAVSGPILERVRFAAENGLVARDGQITLEPKGIITRGEVMAMLERVLALAGEIE